MSEWIAVSDKLPKVGVTVLCWLRDAVVFGDLNRQQNIDDEGRIAKPTFTILNHDYADDTPSHWMPLPDPPTQETA